MQFHLWDAPTKVGLDVAAGSVTLAALFQYLPATVTILTGIWTVIRIYETDTVQRIIKWVYKQYLILSKRISCE